MALPFLVKNERKFPYCLLEVPEGVEKGRAINSGKRVRGLRSTEKGDPTFLRVFEVRT